MLEIKIFYPHFLAKGLVTNNIVSANIILKIFFLDFIKRTLRIWK